MSIDDRQNHHAEDGGTSSPESGRDPGPGASVWEDRALGLIWIAGQLERDLQSAIRRAGGVRRLWEAGTDDLARVFARTPDVAPAFEGARRTFSASLARSELRDLDAWFSQIDVRGWHDWFESTPDPPVGIIGLGTPIEDITATRSPRIAIVGARRPTAFGLQYSTDLAASLGRRGAVIVSGLAMGVDAAAHRGALVANAPTVAVLGCGVGVDHPRTNSELRKRILREGGTVMSEYWPTTTPTRWSFPARNRIVAALADAVVVTEASARSGALITADFALELGRPVLAVPGRPGSAISAGCHALLRAGAAFCETADDVVAELPDALWSDGPGPPQGGGSQVQALAGRIHVLLSAGPLSLPEITETLRRPATEVAMSLTEMELAGMIASVDGQRYAVRAAS